MMLCHELSIPSRRHLRAILTEEEIQEWIFFNSIYPIGKGREDYLAAMIAYTVASTVTKKPKWETFMPNWKRNKNSAAIKHGFMNSAAKHGAIH